MGCHLLPGLLKKQTIAQGRQSSICPLTEACRCADEQRAKAQGQFRLDFSGLKRQHMAARSGKEREALEADFKSEVEEREKALSRAAPNLKALQQFEAVKVSPISAPCLEALQRG